MNLYSPNINGPSILKDKTNTQFYGNSSPMQYDNRGSIVTMNISNHPSRITTPYKMNPSAGGGHPSSSLIGSSKKSGRKNMAASPAPMNHYQKVNQSSINDFNDINPTVKNVTPKKGASAYTPTSKKLYEKHPSAMPQTIPYEKHHQNVTIESSNLISIKDLIEKGGANKFLKYENLNLKKFTKNDFEFGTKLGKGKFGDVYMAREKKTNFIVAIKVLDKTAIRQMKAQKQIIREIKIHSYLNHRNIIKLYGVFHDEEKVYMIIEYAPNGELYKELKSSPKRRFTEEKASKYIKQVIDAFIYLHELEIIHRDLKPENLLNCFGTIKLADFGWSVHAPNAALRKTFCGTLDYVPPEMVQGDRYDCHTDNWSIGILSYEFLTGRPPFEKRSKIDTLNSIVSSKLSMPDYLSKDATDFIGRFLLQDPKTRMELSEALEHPFIKKYN